MKILVVEDASASRILMIKALRSILPKSEIESCVNGKDAMMNLSGETKFDFVILDLGLPDISGFQILEMLSEMSHPATIITISDEGNQENLRKSIELGASNYLTKPISRKQVIGVFEGLVHQSENRKKHWNVLVVDDEKINRVLARRILEKEGHVINEASNGFEALRLMTNNNYDIVLMDIRMPHMDGYETTQHLRKEHPHVPVLAVTAEPLDEVKKMAIEVGIDAAYQKPIIKDQLLFAMYNCICDKEKEWIDNLNIQRSESEKNPLEAKEDYFETIIKFIPRSFLPGQSLSLNGLERGLKEVKDCSVVFVDIRQFTKMTSKMNAEDCFSFLNSYFETLEPIVSSFGGSVYQYLGDGIVCTFPLYRGKSSNNAVHAAISMQDQVNIYNKGRLRAGYDPIKIGCGISTGSVAMGICGSPGRFDVGAFGTTINMSARCQDACKTFGVGITITSDTFDRLDEPSNFLIRPLGTRRFRGYDDPVKLFEVFNHEESDVRKQKLDSSSRIVGPLDEYKNEEFVKLSKEFPQDSLWDKLANIVDKE